MFYIFIMGPVLGCVAMQRSTETTPKDVKRVQ